MSKEKHYWIKRLLGITEEQKAARRYEKPIREKHRKEDEKKVLVLSYIRMGLRGLYGR